MKMGRGVGGKESGRKKFARRFGKPVPNLGFRESEINKSEKKKGCKFFRNHQLSQFPKRPPYNNTEGGKTLSNWSLLLKAF